MSFRQKCLRNTVSSETDGRYGMRIRALSAYGLDYSGFLRFLEANQDLGTGTLRGYKSALMYRERLCPVGERGIIAEESEDLDRCLDGMGKPPTKIRGAITEDMVHLLVDYANEHKEYEVAYAVIVAYGCCMRPRDLLELTPDKIDCTTGFVLVRSKRHKKHRAIHGDYESHMIGTPGAIKLLSELVRTRSGFLFAGLNMNTCRNMVRRCAVAHSWDTRLTFDGLHTLRHGAATDAMSAALKEVRKRGGWACDASAQHYSRTSRGECAQKAK